MAGLDAASAAVVFHWRLVSGIEPLYEVDRRLGHASRAAHIGTYVRSMAVMRKLSRRCPSWPRMVMRRSSRGGILAAGCGHGVMSHPGR